jgi:hypothetical protein
LLARESHGRGWARETVDRLCVDITGDLTESCARDGVVESYLAPRDHRIGVRVSGQFAPGSTCVWAFDNSRRSPRSVPADCREEATVRVRYGRPSLISVEVRAPGEKPRRASEKIMVRDLLIAGLGDSVAAGEGNPDRPIALADEGFCYRTLLAGREYFRPGRLGFAGRRVCGSEAVPSDIPEWSRLSARWLSSACHRSLYSYQLRAALALAVENPHLAVTYLPLACTAATIKTGMFLPQRSLNCDGAASSSCPGSVPGQLARLRELLARAQRSQPDRTLDLVFLTIGANDINFTGMVADVIIDAATERALLRRFGFIQTLENAQSALQDHLPGEFAKMRAALKPLVGGDLEKVVFVTYAHPALSPQGGPCPGGRDGFDVHPAFGIDSDRMRRVSSFIESRFLPVLKALATCADAAHCRKNERMTFTDAHQAAFSRHGVCARAPTDPVFDLECFSAQGKSFAEGAVEGASKPLLCRRSPGEFRPYASRARWIRTVNDSYFAAMTFPEGVALALQPTDLHDAMWGLYSAVYGGAIHPTAEGHAAMADAALAKARAVLDLPQPARSDGEGERYTGRSVEGERSPVARGN